MASYIKRARAAAALCCAAALLLAGCTGRSTPSQATATIAPSPAPTPGPTAVPEDVTPPVITGTRDLVTPLGMTVSYRSGVTVTDDADPRVALQVDASAVDINTPGEYPVVYSATDSRGNTAQAQITLTVVEVAGVDDDDPTKDVTGQNGPPEPPAPSADEVTREMVDQEADKILARIVNDSMSQLEKARAIYTYVNTHIKYVGRSDKSNWLVGAYIGFTRGRGDCYNYFACAKALLTRAGISNIDLYRVGGGTDHYWQLVNVGWGWYHFDACPHPDSYRLTCFLLDEMQVREYTQRCAVRSNYYVYDYAGCMVVPVGFPEEELELLGASQVVEEPQPSEGVPGEETPAPTEGEEGQTPPPEETGDEPIIPPEAMGPGSLTPAVSAAPAPDAPPTPAPEAEVTAAPEASGEPAPSPLPAVELPAQTPEPPQDAAAPADGAAAV